MTAPQRSVLHYNILDQLGAGGMGVVYRALDTRLERMVALKFLPGAASVEPEARQRLILEARAAASLDHPNIGSIYSIDGLESEPFIVMALYEGSSLREKLQGGPLGVRESIDLCMQVARGLERAHQQGITHRDIKPENLFVTTDGTVKILDFGLARMAALDGLTRAGEVIGTPAYLSPEQARGQAVDARTDLWALGVVLYEAATCVSPFLAEGGLAATLLRILRDEPEPASRVRPDLPEALDAIIERALAKDRNDRYASAGEMWAALDMVVADREPGRDFGTATTGPVTAPRATTPATHSREASPSAPPSTTHAPSSVRPSALPTPMGPLVGREDELALAGLHLADPHCRMLTLVGPGGTGKTRLAVEVAHEQRRLGHNPDGVCFVPLDAVADAALIPLRIADALELGMQGQDDPLTQVLHYIGDRRLLLVLDNYEHLMEGAEIPSSLAHACPNLKIIVTSRERLNLHEEWVLPLGGLQTPPQGPVDPRVAETYEAVQLFLQRAKRANMRFAVESEDLPHICTVCHLVGGSPLGLEMAAAWTKMVSCEEIAREIRTNLDFLESSGRNVSERHRSLRATFEYSWVLLSRPEQEVLTRLSVFRGGFGKEAARDVAGANLQLLASLVDKSLLDALPAGRYDFHPLIHQYAEEKLIENPGEIASVEERHGRYYHQFLHGQLDELRGSQQAQVHEAIGVEFENVRKAWQWAVDGRRLDQLSKSLKPLDVFLDNKGRHREAAEIMNRASSALDDGDPANHEILGELLASEAFANWRFGRGAEARARAERSVALLRPSRHRSLAGALNTLGAVAWGEGDFQQAKNAWEEVLEVVEKDGDRWNLASILGNLATAEEQLGESAKAKQRFMEALAIYRELDSPAGIATVLHNLSVFALDEGDLEQAQKLTEEAVRLARDNDLVVHLPILLQGMGTVLMARERYAEVEPHYLEALALTRQSGEKHAESWLLAGLGSLKTLQGEYQEAREYFATVLHLAWSTGYQSIALRCLVGIAYLQLRTGDDALSAMTYLHHVRHHPAAGQSVLKLANGYLEAHQLDLSPTEAEEAQRAGVSLSLEQAVERALQYLGDQNAR